MVSSHLAIAGAHALRRDRAVRRAAGPVLGLLALLVLPGVALGALELNLTESASGTTVDVAKGAAITITLDSNATTGYRWIESTSPDPSVVAEDKDSGTYVAPDTTLLGAGGKQVFAYHGAGDGTTSIALQYVAPGTNAVAKTFTLTIHVGPVEGMLDATAVPPATSTATTTDRSGLAVIGLLGLLGLLGGALVQRRLAR